MTERHSRPSFPSMRPLQPAARLPAELAKLKITPDKIAVDERQQRNLSDALRLASAFDDAPHPVFIIDLDTQRLLLANKAALAVFPEAPAKGVDHPALAGWRQVGDRSKAVLADYAMRDRTFQRTIAVSEGIAQIHFMEARRPALEGVGGLSFPVIEYSLGGFVSFRNEPSRKRFPDPEVLLRGVRENVASLKTGKTFADTISVESRLYRRAASYIAQSDSVRIYAVDITDVASKWKSAILALAAEVESAGSRRMDHEAVGRIDRAVATALEILKSEKVGIGKMELELYRLQGLLRASRNAKDDELVSLGSVTADFLRNLK
ncbi:MAG: PAS domain-containing protein [Candidatus Micrarchaeota archaeon]